MNQDLKKELMRASVSTFEEMAFMVPMPEMSSDRACRTEASAAVEFQGPLSGRLVVSAEETLLQGLAASMLGEDQSTGRQQQFDALGEIANVICGNFLPAVAGSAPLFHISAPTFSAGEYLEEGAGSAAVTIELPLDQGRAVLSLYLN